MEEYEKLGAFYLGKSYDLERNQLQDELVLYDSKDLTTHAVIIGMTGSGKTGLGLGMIEEAAIDHIPVIAIDPKGDLGNLLLTFPELRAEDFQPWVNPKEAEKKEMSLEAYAEAQASLWRDGLAAWGQDGARIARLREAADLDVYTPGSSAGLPVSVLRSFQAPSPQLKADLDLYRERIQATATSLLALLDISADPLTSREHILFANILQHYWDADRSLDVAGLIAAIQQPPMERIGVMDIESFFSAKDRFALAMRLNNLLAAPGFEAWMEGEPLDAGRLLYTESGKPRVSIMSIAHLSDPERMFFVSMLLNEILSWMRAQSGTSSLRAMLYMDEIFGYMPPTANPPSKVLLLTLLKQARAYGLGLVLSTQNPVDLDYKGLANTGTWFIGRMQTERDKARVMEGLEGAAAGGRFDKQAMEQRIAGLGKRVFLMHNVHENAPVVFNTRWTLSYLAGPLTRSQIKALMQARKTAEPARASLTPAAQPAAAEGESPHPPALAPQIDQFYLPALRTADSDHELVYHPMVIGAADVGYSSARYKLNEERRFAFLVEADDGPVPVDWERAEALELDFDKLETAPAGQASFAELAPALSRAGNFAEWQTLFKRWIGGSQALPLLKSPTYKTVSQLGESERDFRIRLQELANEKRDAMAETLRKRYGSRITVLENRLQRAEQQIARESEQASQKKMDTLIAFGSAVLGAFLGRKRLSTASATRVGSAVKTAGRMRKEAADVERAQQMADTTRRELEALQTQFEQEVAKLALDFDAQRETLEQIEVKPKSTEIHIHFVGLAWAPYYRNGKGRLLPAWQQA
jgi:hypothetical protein